MKSKKIIISLIVVILVVATSIVVINKKQNTAVRYDISSNSGVVSTNTGNTETKSESGIISQNQTEGTPLAYINSFDGDVNKIASGNKEIVTNGMVLKESDSIITQEGTAEIIFADNSVVRLNKNATLTFTKLSQTDTETNLENGEIWVRILKPITDSSFFSIKTSDVSAGVRGTSVVLKKSKTGTDIKVIDSYNPDPKKKGVLLTYFNKKQNKKVEEVIMEESHAVVNNSTENAVRQPLDSSKMFDDDFIRDNTQKDIVYMDSIKDKVKDKKEVLDKINGELAQSLPKSNEIKSFFKEEVLKDKIENGGTGAFDPNNLIDSIKKEVVITGDRQFIEKTKTIMGGGGISPEDKQKLEEQIKQREASLNTVIEDIKKEITTSGATIQQPETPIIEKPKLEIVIPKTPLKPKTPIIELQKSEPTPEPVVEQPKSTLSGE